MPQQPVTTNPGVILSVSDYAAMRDVAYIAAGNTYRQGQGRWVNGVNIEFVAGFPQKIAGWVQATPSTTDSIPRCICPWMDNAGVTRTGIGTETGLYYLKDNVLTDIMPLQTILRGTLTDALTTIAGSELVSVADSTQALQVGDWVQLTSATPVGGILFAGWFNVASRSGTGYTITTPYPAGSSQSSGGGSIDYGYPRVTLTDPFTTTAGSTTVTVTHTAHNQIPHTEVYFSGVTTVGGVSSLNDGWFITAVTGPNTYTITLPTPATSTATGGGGLVSTIYEIYMQQAGACEEAYNNGNFNAGSYGVGISSTPTLANGWTLAAYGAQLLCAPIGGTIYVFDPQIGGRAYPLANAPKSMNAMFVTPERFVVALGIDGIPLRIAWCDQNDYTVWTTLPTNTANSGRNLIGGSFFVGGIAVRNSVSLLFTDRAVFEMNYLGGSEVYATLLIGDNCGLVSPTALCCEGGIVFWMSDQDFWSWNGNVAVLPTDDVRSFVFNNINRQFLTKCTASLNRAKRQVRFWYPTAGGTENDLGIIFQIDQSCFSEMGFGRSASHDASLLDTPISGSIDGMIFYDETGADANGHPLGFSLQRGMTDLSNGDTNVDVFGFTPDFQYCAGTLNLAILTKYYPDGTLETDGPYPITFTTTQQDLRSNGRLFGFTLEALALGTNFRLGVPKLEIKPAGTRR